MAKPSDILFLGRPLPPPVCPLALGMSSPFARALEAASLNAACAGALCLLLFFLAPSLGPVAEDPDAAGAAVGVGAGSGGRAEVPALVMYARPSRWSPSLLSNLAGKNMSGNLRGFGRWNA